MSERVTVIVTGGSSGIGLATAKLLRRAVAATSRSSARSADKLAAAEKELRAIATAAGQRIETRSATSPMFEQARDGDRLARRRRASGPTSS